MWDEMDDARLLELVSGCVGGDACGEHKRNEERAPKEVNGSVCYVHLVPFLDVVSEDR